MKITSAKITYVPEKLISPFGFKGGYLTELWQVICRIESENACGVGVGVQSVLWSDARIFAELGEEKGNLLMYEISEKALSLLIGKTGENPIEFIDGIFKEVSDFAYRKYGKKIRETFIRNALVCVDNALWVLFAREKKTENFMDLLPKTYRKALSSRQSNLSNVPLISYNVSESEIRKILEGGVSLLKIKIGNDNGGKFSKEEMLEWDMQRLLEIHNIAKAFKSKYSVTGKILYYVDANQKYDSKERLMKLLDFVDKNHFLEEIVLFEEPFEENNKTYIGDLPVRIVGDESIHSVKDVEERITLGYKAVALKPIAKTLSETIKIVKKANEKEIICFCADLTVNPLLVEWNKNIAARISPLPEMNIGIIESNGAQNYMNWEKMRQYSPAYQEKYASPIGGVYILNNNFYATSGNIFKECLYYDEKLKGKNEIWQGM